MVTFTSFAVLATPIIPPRISQAITDDSGPDATDNVTTDQGLNDPNDSSPYYVSITDVDQVNALLKTRGLPIVKGMQLPGMPIVRVLYLDPRTRAELEASSGVAKVLPYLPPDFEDPVPNEDIWIALAPPTTYDYDVDVVHGAASAWSLGYTGAGVKVAVIDTGFDMGHPDLQGQQARYSSGPYAGWPIVYDDYAAAGWGLGAIGGWVANTTAVSNDTGGFVHLDNKAYAISNLTDSLGNHVASASGTYHVGHHTDPNLALRVGHPVGVLVVDSTTPGFYDTVYVDLLGDYDFGNDKPCVKGDEISFFDSYNSTANTTQTVKWSGGDGYADVSGGMVYWISDGVNVLPGSNWTYGATFTPASGDAVAFVGEFSLGLNHGTMTASAALATGRSASGRLEGMAPGARLIAIPFTFDMYNSWMFAEYGADGVPNTGDEANIVSNSYGWSETAVDAGYEYLDQTASMISLSGGKTLWCWAAGNGGPGYGTTASVIDFSSIRVGAGTTMQYRTFLGLEPSSDYAKWGDVAPFSNAGPTRTGKLGSEIIASGMYSLEPAPLNSPDYDGRSGDGSTHYQLGSGTSHAAPTVAGAAALGYQAYYAKNGEWPSVFVAKSRLMASSDDMHFDPFKQGAGWLNASSLVKFMGESDGTMSETSSLVGTYETAALYPGNVYGASYETFANFLLPGEQDTNYTVKTENLNSTSAITANVKAQILIRTGSGLVNHTTITNDTEYVDITNLVRPGTDLVKVTMFLPLSVYDPDLNYVSDVGYNLELYDWVDLDMDGKMNTSTNHSELFRYSVDSGDCNYNQVMIRDPLDRTHDGLVAAFKPAKGAQGVNLGLQVDSYELQTFPWIDFQRVGDTTWNGTLSMSIPALSNASWHVRVSVPSGTPFGTYGAIVYVDSGDRIQALPVVINVPSPNYEFTFGQPYPFDTTYDNNLTGLANRQWRYDTGDWRIYWSLPSSAPPNPSASLIVTASWTEMPTTMNLYVLAAQANSFSREQFTKGPLDSPWGPGWDMVQVAASGDGYKGAGIFAVGSNTGEPKEAVAAPLGDWVSKTHIAKSPFMILIRCPVMSGNHSSDHFAGSTTWVTLNSYEPKAVSLTIPVPSAIPLTGVVEGGYNFTCDAPIEVRGGGSVSLDRVFSYTDLVSQGNLTGNLVADLAGAAYTRHMDVADADTLKVRTLGLVGVPDLDLGLWLDANRNGVADLSEPHWTSSNIGSSELITLDSPSSGTYIIKVLGRNVTGSPGFFFLEVSETFGGYIEARGFESPVASGVHNFSVAYDVPASPGTYRGAATFGFMGADDMFSIPVTITIIDQPVMEDLRPENGAVLATPDPDISFRFHDSAGANIGISPSSLRIYLDGIIDLSPWAVIAGDNVTARYPFLLAEGWHSVTVNAMDLDGNPAPQVSTTFRVNSQIDLSFALVNPLTNFTVESGATVSLNNVTIVGSTDPNSSVSALAESGSYSAQAGPTGAFAISDVRLVEGLNVITVVATNDANASASQEVVIVSDTYCSLEINPVPELTSSDAQVLDGRVEQDATVTINGTTVPVSDEGVWSFTIGLTDGPNYISISATDKVGNSANVTLLVVCDRTPPALTVFSPHEGSRVGQPVVEIHGNVEAGATVTVNGVPAAVEDLNWTAHVALVNGTNIVRVVATDAAGNQAERILMVEYDPSTYITPDWLQQALDQLNNTLRQAIEDADAFASLVMFLALILFLVSILVLGAVWYVLAKRLREATQPEEEQSLEEIEEEPPDVEREFEELEKEIRRDEGP